MTACLGRDPLEPCHNVAVVEVDTNEVGPPDWIDPVPMCLSCASNAHRGGFTNWREID